LKRQNDLTKTQDKSKTIRLTYILFASFQVYIICGSTVKSCFGLQVFNISGNNKIEQ